MAGDGDSSDDELARTATAPGSTGTPLKDAAELGATLGRYRLERELGAGGMGVVHAAFDPDLERRVALKVLRIAGSDEARQRLLREARALARLTHANVVTVHEVGSANGRDYVAMELIVGETLADWLKAAPRTHAEILATFTFAGRGLAAAHAAGLVHRDFKPHNVLRGRDGRIVVTDFGLARGIEVAIELETTMRLKGGSPQAANTPSSLSGLTQTGSLLGTPAYMAPEQWSGESVGPAADQFAFCVALWEALAGERPFRGGTLEALQAAVKGGPSKLDDSKLPRPLRAPLKRGLDPDPARRWPSMDALIAAITRVDRPRGVLLMIFGSAVVAGAVGYVALAGHDKPGGGAATCDLPLLEPAAVWSPVIATNVRDKTSPEIAHRFDAVFGSWQAARSAACSITAPMRVRRLACLDGVLARFDAVRKASLHHETPSLDDVAFQLIDPSVCNVEDPPRLPIRLSAAVVPALAFAYQPDSQDEFDEAAEAAAWKLAGDDRCARAFVRLARVRNDDSMRARDAAEDAVQLADACGDDRIRADALVSQLRLQFTMFIDPKLQKSLPVAEAAVRRVSQQDLVARLDMVKAIIASASGQWEQCLKLADSAIRGYGELRPRSRLEAVLAKVRALRARRHRGDLDAARAELARWRPDAERSGNAKMLLELDKVDAALQWELGDVAGANTRFPELITRIEATRTKPDKGKPLSGTVVDAAGKPVPGARVAAGDLIVGDSVAIGYVENVGQARLATTDGQGRFQLDHVPDDAVVVAQLGAQRSFVRPAKDGDRLRLQPTTTISGRVLGPEPNQLTVFVVHGDLDKSPKYQLMAPVAPDGSFTISGVPIGRLRIGALQFGAGMSQAISMQDITVGAKGVADVVVKRAGIRKLSIVVRSSAEMPLSGAQVFVVAGTFSIKSLSQAETLLRQPGIAVELARPLVGGEPPPEVGTLLPGDTLATFTNAPDGAASACAVGLSGDFADPAFREKVQRHADELEVRCVPVAADAKAVTVEVPPMKRLD